MPVSKEKILELQKVETYEKLGIHPKWYVDSTKNGKAVALPHQDARDVFDVLDHVCGPQDWQTEPREIGGRLFYSIAINIKDEGWVHKADIGSPRKGSSKLNENKQNSIERKSEASDAIKRAGVHWGIFRDRYKMSPITLNATPQGKATTSNGKVLYTTEQLSAYCNKMNTELGKLVSIYNSFKGEFQSHPDAMKALSTLKEFLQEIQE